jgi:carboxypeptidase PM20D1
MTEDQQIQHLQKAIQCETVSYPDRSRINFKEYDKFIDHLKHSYPLLHKRAKLELVEKYSLVFHLKGTTDKDPIALMGHYDVVPVKPERWTNPPFSGEVIDGYVYGRGTLDMKGQVIAVLEAVESCLEEGVVFERDVYLLFGHNEETGSEMPDSGAKNTRNLLKSRGIHFNLVVDEGGAYIDGKALGVPSTVVLVGVGEKGYLDVELSATQAGGHASMPPHTSALYDVFQAAMKMESHKFQADFNPATDAMFKALVPYMKQPMKFLFKYRNIFKPIILLALVKSPDTAATVRTTSVMTMAQGSSAPNVLAQVAKVNINCRIVPGDSIERVKARIENRVGPKIKINLLNGTQPTDICRSDIPQFALIEKAVKTIYPEIAVVAPYLMVAATDSRVYHGMAEAVYRVEPFASSKDDRHTVHADNERLKIDSFLKGIELFRIILKEGTKANS